MPARSPDAIRRVPAEALEAFILSRLQAMDPTVVSYAELADRVRRISLRDGSVRIEIGFAADRIRDRVEREAILARTPRGDEASFEGRVLHLTAPVRMKFRGGRTWLDLPDGVAGRTAPQVDRTLVAGLRRAHAALAEHVARPQSKPDELFNARCPASPYVVRLCRLAMLAPDIQRAILEGRQPKGLTLQQLLDAEIAVSWVEQRAALGFAAA
jgi:site-specific DNA recombinase